MQNQENIYNQGPGNVSYDRQRTETEYKVLRNSLGCCQHSVFGWCLHRWSLCDKPLSVLFWHLCIYLLYFILKLLKYLIDHVVPYRKPSNRFFSYSHLERACFPSGHFSVGRVSCFCSRRQLYKVYLRVCIWISFSSCNTLLLGCHINVSSLNLKVVIFSGMHSVTTYSKLKGIHQLFFITFFISFILGSSTWWSEFVSSCIQLWLNVKSSL